MLIIVDLTNTATTSLSTSASDTAILYDATQATAAGAFIKALEKSAQHEAQHRERVLLLDRRRYPPPPSRPAPRPRTFPRARWRGARSWPGKPCMREGADV